MEMLFSTIISEFVDIFISIMSIHGPRATLAYSRKLLVYYKQTSVFGF